MNKYYNLFFLIKKFFKYINNYLLIYTFDQTSQIDLFTDIKNISKDNTII
jgi:hypothetical protein